MAHALKTVSSEPQGVKRQSRSNKFAQRLKWFRCSIMTTERSRENNDKETTKEPLAGIQGKSSLRCLEGRTDDR